MTIEMCLEGFTNKIRVYARLQVPEAYFVSTTDTIAIIHFMDDCKQSVSVKYTSQATMKTFPPSALDTGKVRLLCLSPKKPFKAKGCRRESHHSTAGPKTSWCLI